MKIEKKKAIVDALQEKFDRSKIVIATDYKGLNVAKMNELRRKLRAADIEYSVVKNTLLVRAAEGTDVSVIADYFKGPTAIALSYEDPVSIAKILTDFAKENEKLKITIGEMSGKVMDLEAIKTLSSLPSREELLAKLLSVLIGVPTSFVRALNGISVQFLNVLQAIKEQKEKQEAA